MAEKEVVKEKDLKKEWLKSFKFTDDKSVLKDLIKQVADGIILSLGDEALAAVKLEDSVLDITILDSHLQNYIFSDMNSTITHHKLVVDGKDQALVKKLIQQCPLTVIRLHAISLTTDKAFLSLMLVDDLDQAIKQHIDKRLAELDAKKK